MFRRLSPLMVLILTLSLSGTVLAQEPVTPQQADPTWKAMYWNNTTQAGTPDLQRGESAIDHDWGLGSPHPLIEPDVFSARWTRRIDFIAGLYRFTATSDDGIRVWVDNELIIDQWYDHPARTFTADKRLSDGQHWVVVEYYENRGFATAELSWLLVADAPVAWQGEYFNNTTLSGTPSLVRSDSAISFDWGAGSPAPGPLGPDRFSVRWTQTLELPAGRYRFVMTVDDGGRLWVNGRLLIEAWREQAATTYSADIFVPGGSIPVRMEYYEHAGVAVAQLSWARIDTEPMPGIVIVDDAGPGFAQGGLASGWRREPEGFGGELTWTWNNDSQRPNYNWARWSPNLIAGRYEVSVFVPDRFSTTSSARYRIVHANGSELRTVDQSATGGQWVSLGTFWFDGTQDEYVLLTDITFESLRSRLVAFDAIQWTPR